MLRSALRIGLLVAGLLVAFFAGLLVGNRWTFSWMMGVQETEVLGGLNFAVEALAALRVGEPELAIRLYEQRVDAAVATLPQRREWSELSPSLRRGLVLAKKYREVYPPETPSPRFFAAYGYVKDEPIDFGSCRPSVRRWLEIIEAQSGEGSFTPP